MCTKTMFIQWVVNGAEYAVFVISKHMTYVL